MKITLSIFCLCLTIFLCGCTPVVSIHPLFTQAEIDKPLSDPRIEGQWIIAKIENPHDDPNGSQKPCRISIGKPGTNNFAYSAEFHCPGSESDAGEGLSKYNFQVVSLNNALFFDAQFVEHAEGGKSISMSEVVDKGVAPAHLLGQVWIQQDFVRFAPIQADWVDEKWPAGYRVNAKVGEYNDVRILTNPTPDLRDLLSRNADSLPAFGFGLYLCRPADDCDKRSVEDQLVRTPDEWDVLDSAVNFYAKRGEFARAIALQRHKIELSSDPGTDQYELARLLLLTRDFEGARGALAAAKEPVEKPSIGELVVRSHFLQGDYAKTVQAAKSYKAPPNIVSVDPMVLCYFAMYRLGRAKEAESYVREQAATFVGPAQEHLLLLRLMGRVTDSPPSEDQDRNAYYYALNELMQGKVDSGRSYLQDLTRTQSKDSLIGLAAQIELERLASTLPQK